MFGNQAYRRADYDQIGRCHASREVTSDDVANALTQTVPLYETYEERIKELRDWARTRARSASLDSRMVDLFG